jgi:predicted metal-dependent phosphoesterase TrpH
MNEVRVLLHCHTEYSSDATLKLAELGPALQAAGIGVVAITDHNTIEGAQQLQASKPEWLNVIVGEEITTAQGDLIGLFLTERVEPNLPLLDTIMAIRGQGGVVMVPHPFDRVRRRSLGQAVVESYLDKIDLFETYNARCLWPGDNQAAAAFARENSLVAVAGSDAHTAAEVGNAVCVMAPFADRAGFLHNLTGARLVTKAANPLAHLSSVANKWRKRGDKHEG